MIWAEHWTAIRLLLLIIGRTNRNKEECNISNTNNVGSGDDGGGGDCGDSDL